MTILHIDSSPLGAASVSRLLTDRLVQGLRSTQPDATVIQRDLAAAPPDHLGAEALPVVKFGQTEDLTPRQQAERTLTDQLVEEFLAAETVVIGAPMYNFSIPTQLKAWIDRIAQPGRTFRYSETGPIGLAGGRTVYIVSTRGGRYAGTPFETALDHQEAYLRAVFGFLGVTEIVVIRAEGVALGAEARAAAIAAAEAEIARIV